MTTEYPPNSSIRVNSGPTLISEQDIRDLMYAGCEFIATRADKSVVSYDPLSPADAIAHVGAGNMLGWRHDRLSLVDVDRPRHHELMYELAWRGIPLQYSTSLTPDHGHVMFPTVLDDYDWNCAYGFGETRYFRYKQLYQVERLKRACQLEFLPSIQRTLVEMLPPAPLQPEVPYPGTEIRVKSFGSRLLNKPFDWQSYAAAKGIRDDQARAQWITGQLYADRELAKAKERALPLTALPRSRNLVAVYALMCAVTSEDECWLSQVLIASALGITQRAVGFIFEKLASLGYIQRIGVMPNRGQGSDVVKWRLLQ